MFLQIQVILRIEFYVIILESIGMETGLYVEGNSICSP